MDNVSHTLVSLAAAELIHRSLLVEPDEFSQRLRQKLLLLAAAVAGNLPDLDLFLSPLLRRPLGYLLHHRGHSHTFLFEIPQALVLFGLTWLLWPAARRLLRASSTARLGYACALAAGFVSHIAMDFLNSYGVHPFYPFDAHWLYGDLVFILEPLFWVAFGVPLAILMRRVWLRYPLLLTVLALPVFGAARGYLPWFSCSVLFAIAAGLGLLQRRDGFSGRRGLASAFAVLFLFIGVQAFASHAGRLRVVDLIHAREPQAKVLDVAMNAAPFDPLCWSFISIEENAVSDSYRLRTGLVSIAPSAIAADDCPSIFGRGGAQPAPGSKGDPFVTINPRSVSQTSEISAPISVLRQLNEQNCFVNAWMRFARMPYVTDSSADDLRFSRGGPRTSFSSLDLSDFAGIECPTGVPQWIPPREDLLGR